MNTVSVFFFYPSIEPTLRLWDIGLVVRKLTFNFIWFCSIWAYLFTLSMFVAVFFLFNALKLQSLLYFISFTAISLRYHCTQYSFLFSFKVRKRVQSHTYTMMYYICKCNHIFSHLLSQVTFHLYKTWFFILFPNKSHQKQ